MAEHLLECQHKRILVAVAESPQTGYQMQEPLSLRLVPDMGNAWMLRIERQEPVGSRAEEGEALHLRESGKINVGAPALHVGHLAHAGLHTLHVALSGIGMKNVLQLVFLHLYNALTRNADVIALDKIGHNLALDCLRVVVGLHAIYNLYLQLRQLVQALLVRTQLTDNLMHLWIERCLVGIGGKHPANQSPLSQLLIGGEPVDRSEQMELIHVERHHCRQHQRTHNQLLVERIDGGRKQQIKEFILLPIRHSLRCNQVVKQIALQLLMLSIQLALSGLAQMFRLQFEHGNIRDKAFQRSFQTGDREGATEN